MRTASFSHALQRTFCVAALMAASWASACPTEIPAGLSAEAVGEKTVVNGMPVVIHQVNGKERSADILARVAKTWADEKRDVRRDNVGSWDVVAVRSAKCSTTLQLIDRNGSFGYFAVGEPARSTAWLPKTLNFTMPSGVTLNSTVSSSDSGRAGHTITFSTRRSVSDINDYFLRSRGQKSDLRPKGPRAVVDGFVGRRADPSGAERVGVVVSSRRAQQGAGGQASLEYMVILALVTIVLIAVTAEPNTIQDLIDAAKSFFKAFSYALSIPAQDRL
jgi:Flp pilus assembly pilin Flp